MQSELDSLRKINQFLTMKLAEEYAYNCIVRSTANSFFYSTLTYITAS